MKKIKKMLKVFVFVLLIMLALVGIGLPIPMFPDHLLGPKNAVVLIDKRHKDKSLEDD